jgi:hypothetical protein
MRGSAGRSAGGTRVLTSAALLCVLAGLMSVMSGCGMTIYKPARSAGAVGIDGLVGTADGSGEAGGEAGATSELSALKDEVWMKPEAWPARWAVWSGLRRSTLANSPVRPMGIVTAIRGPVRAMRAGPESQQKIEQEQTSDVAQLMYRRRVRVSEGVVRFEGEGRGSFVFLSRDEREDGGGEPPIKAAMYLKFISGREVPMSRSLAEPGSGVRRLGGDDDKDAPDQATRLVQIQRTWFAYYDPTPGVNGSSAEKPKGVAVLMPGLFGTPDNVILPLIREMQGRGWGVLRMLAHPSRFTERVVFEINKGDNLDQKGALIADILTDRAAECAYSVHAALLYLRQEKPGTAGLPTTLIGMSGGAMVLPTVMARDPGQFQSAVVIAGGVDYLRVAMESNYTGWIDAVKVKIAEEIDTPELRAELVKAYQKHAPLDTTQTTRVLRLVPTLMVHGTTDRAVPAHLGDESWEVAGRPERWVYEVGHELLFFSLPWQIERMADWIEQHTPRPREKGGSAGVGAGGDGSAADEGRARALVGGG